MEKKRRITEDLRNKILRTVYGVRACCQARKEGQSVLRSWTNLIDLFHGNDGLGSPYALEIYLRLAWCLAYKITVTKITHWNLGNNKLCKSQFLQREHAKIRTSL